jgi:hypothetical protein
MNLVPVCFFISGKKSLIFSVGRGAAWHTMVWYGVVCVVTTSEPLLFAIAECLTGGSLGQVFFLFSSFCLVASTAFSCKKLIKFGPGFDLHI